MFYLININNLTSKYILLTFSSLFYAYWSYEYFILLVVSIVINYQLGKFVFKKSSKPILILGISFNILLLCYFKYTIFILNEINFSFSTQFSIPKIILPLAISFYTFQQIAYLTDSYKNKVETFKFLDYALFVSFFPQLIAGPIVHHKQLIPQFNTSLFNKFQQNNFNLGLIFFFIGLAKKCLIADNLSEYVTPIFIAAEQNTLVTFVESWLASIAYTLQLYFDFSGYSDMAIGLGYFFNVEIPINFRSPLRSLNIIDFWRRWHITLSQFLKDYLYIPLGGNKKGTVRRYVNLLITMILGGIWHGAGWTFFVWGTLHGTYLTINHLWQKIYIANNNFLYSIFSWITTFISVVIAFTIFKAKTLAGATVMLKGMLGYHATIPAIGQLEKTLPSLSAGPDIGPTKVILVWLPITILFLFFGETPEILRKKYIEGSLNKYFPYILGSIIILSLLSLNKASEFLYFQF